MTINNNGILDRFDEYIKFSKTIQENNENVRLISNRIRTTNVKKIKTYYSYFFKRFFSKDKYKNISPFFRILTVNKIRSSDKYKNDFNSLDEFDNYVEEFKEKLLSEEFPNNFKEDIAKINEIDSYDFDGKTYLFNLDFIKEFTEIKPKSIKSQLKNYANFQFFRHFILYYTDESFVLREKYKDLWNKNIYNFLIKTLQVDKQDFFIDCGTYFKKRGHYESEDTWGALVKNEIAGFSIEEEKKEALQLFININPNGLKIGTYLGTDTNEQIAGFIKKQVNLKREDIIGEFKKLKRKYSQNIQIEYKIKKKDKEYDLNEDLNDEIIQDKVLNLFKVSLSIVYKDFQGSLEEFSNILKDIFKIYNLLVDKLEFEPNLEFYLSDDVSFIDFKDQIVKKLKQEFIEIDLDKIVSKILAVLDIKKNVILIGAPGTGKTQILETVFRVLSINIDFIDDLSFTTASSDWSIFDTIGGMVPFEEDNLTFRPGLFLKCFSEEGKIINRWLIVDELNRANIDKAFGYFFSLFSNQEVELPFQTVNEETVKVIPLTKWLNDELTKAQIIEKIMGDSKFERFFMTPNWRMGGTINSSDKASLHQLSHAFIRRFGFVNIPLPGISEFMNKFDFKELEKNKKIQLEFIWEEVNKIYEIGPAIIIDMYKLMRIPNINILDAFEANIMPQIDYLPDKDINILLDNIIKRFKEEDKKIIEGFRILKIKELY